MGASTGTLFGNSLTVMLIVSESVSEPSETVMVTWKVGGTWSSEGIQEKTPAGVMDAPSGAPGPREKVRVLTGMSESDAPAVKVKRMPSSTVFGPMVSSTGAAFTSFTVMVMVSESMRTWSDTTMVTWKLPGPRDSEGTHVNSPVTESILAPMGSLSNTSENLRA